MRTLSDRVFNQPLAIAANKLDVIVRQVVLPHLADGSVPQAALTFDGDKSDRKPYSVTAEGVAVIDVNGTLVRKASGLNAVSGLSSYEELGSELAKALADPDVRGILLRCDSPGGEVAGLYDFVDELFAARQTKPIYAVASEMAFSAAYAVASAADRIFITRTGGVGSIGVVCCHVDESGADAKAGLKYEYVYCGDHKADGNPHEPLSDSARGVLEDEVGRVYALLTQTVARNRGMTIKAVKATEAAMYFAEDAIDAGLADEIGTEDDACDALVAAIQGAPFQGGSILGHASTVGRTSSASRSPGIVAACNRLAARMTGKTETPPAPRQASSGLMKAGLAPSQPKAGERTISACRSPGIVFAAKQLGARMLGNAEPLADAGRRMSGIERRCLAMSSKTILTDIESLPKAARAGGLISKCLAMRERMLAEAGQGQADAPTGGVIAKTRAIAARMGALPRTSAGLEEETYQ